MKKIITLCILVLIFGMSFAQTWTQVAAGGSYPGCGGRGSGQFSIGDTCYFVGGAPFCYQTWGFDILTGTWTQQQNYPNTVDGVYVGLSLNGLGYIATGVGFGDGWDSTLWQFNPTATTQWTKLAHFPGQPRGYDVGFALDGMLFVGSGIGNSKGSVGLPLNDFYEYNPPTNTWKAIANYPGNGTQYNISFTIGDKAYVGCGNTVNSSGSTVSVDSDFWEYDTTSKVWTRIASFAGGPRAAATSFSVDSCNRGYVGLGYSDVNQTVFDDDFWYYDPGANNWTQFNNFNGGARCNANGFVIGKSFFVGLGWNASVGSGTLGDFWEYVHTPGFTANTLVCQGSIIQFADTSNYSPTNWAWSFPGGTPDSSNIDSPSITYNDTGTFSVTLTAYNSCDSATKTFASYVHVGAGGALTISPSPDTICNGQSSIVHVNGGGSGFIWTPTTGITDSTLSGDSITISPTGNIVYSVTGTGTGGCAYFGEDSITVNSAAAFNILPLDTGFCNGQSAVLYVQGGGSGFIWTPASGITDSTQSSTGDSVTVSPLVTTTYSVTGINIVGCSSSGTDVVTITPSPNKPTFTQNGNTLTSSSQYDNQWYRNDTLLLNDTSQNLTVTISGEYLVVVNNEANGCSTSSDSAYVKLSGINQLSIINDQLSIYPNPFNNNINIQINSSAVDVKNWNLQITDELGRTVFSTQSLDYSNVIDLSTLSNGVYFIIVINKTGRAVMPVVKQN